MRIIVPSDMTPDEQWRANDEYVSLDEVTSRDKRIAELEAACKAALKHADANGMGAWPVFKKIRKALNK